MYNLVSVKALNVSFGGNITHITFQCSSSYLSEINLLFEVKETSSTQKIKMQNVSCSMQHTEFNALKCGKDYLITVYIVFHETKTSQCAITSVMAKAIPCTGIHSYAWTKFLIKWLFMIE